MDTFSVSRDRWIYAALSDAAIVCPVKLLPNVSVHLCLHAHII